MSFTDILAIMARTFVPKVLVDQRSSKSRNVLDTVISLVSMWPMPAPIHNASSVSMRDASESEGAAAHVQSLSSPTSVAGSESLHVRCPMCTRRRSRRGEPLAPSPRGPFSDRETKNITSAITAASNVSSSNGRAIGKTTH